MHATPNSPFYLQMMKDVMGPFQDIPGPEISAGSKVMSWCASIINRGNMRLAAWHVYELMAGNL